MRKYALAASAVSAAACLVGCGVPTVTTNASGTTTSSPASAQAAAKAAASIGSTIDLSGDLSGEKMAVTVVKVIVHAHGAGMFNTPGKGKRFYAVQFRLKDIGTAAYSDSPSNGAEVVDSLGQSYQSDVYDVRRCQSFPGNENIAVRATGLGCVVFQIPQKAKITEIQFTLDSGFANQTGQWKA
jgi:hypothetical protein